MRAECLINDTVESDDLKLTALTTRSTCAILNAVKSLQQMEQIEGVATKSNPLHGQPNKSAHASDGISWQLPWIAASDLAQNLCSRCDASPDLSLRFFPAFPLDVVIVGKPQNKAFTAIVGRAFVCIPDHVC